MASMGSLGGLGRNLRACMICSIIQPQNKFISSGCPNCDSLITLQNQPETVSEVTSPNFNGVIHLAQPSTSWVAKWQRLDSYVPGLYAVQVIGTPPGEVLDSLEDAGVKYVPRDGTRDEEVGGGRE